MLSSLLVLVKKNSILRVVYGLSLCVDKEQSFLGHVLNPWDSPLPDRVLLIMDGSFFDVALLL